jgi:DNA-binding IclR family transcriptional regulator
VAEGSVTRTLRVLVALCEHGPQTLNEIAGRTELAPPTALRFLRLMRDAGFATQGEDRQWRPTLLTWRLGCAVVDGGGWGALVDDALRTASREIGETVVYAGYDEGFTVYLSMVEPRRDMRTHVTLGARYRATATITGRCMLAFQPEDEVERVLGLYAAEGTTKRAVKALRGELAQIRADRSASGAGDVWQGLWGAAAPVIGRDGFARGAIGTAIATGRPPEHPERVIAALTAAAAALSAR